MKKILCILRKTACPIGLAFFSLLVQFNLAFIATILGKNYRAWINETLGGRPLPLFTEWSMQFFVTASGSYTLNYFYPASTALLSLIVFCAIFRRDQFNSSFFVGLAYIWLATALYYTSLLLALSLPFVTTLSRLTPAGGFPITENAVPLGMNLLAWFFIGLSAIFIAFGIRCHLSK